MYKKNNKKVKVTEKLVSFRFFNGGKQYVCCITAPINIPTYRLKEVFDNTFVGKKTLPENASNFKKLDKDISYSIKTVKEFEECQTNK